MINGDYWTLDSKNWMCSLVADASIYKEGEISKMLVIA